MRDHLPSRHEPALRAGPDTALPKTRQRPGVAIAPPGPERNTSVTADRTSRPAHHPGRRTRLLAGAALPLILTALAACGYGSEAAPSSSAPTVKASGHKLSADSVTIGYFANVTHATALVGVERGLFQKELGGTQLKTQVFNAGPSEMEALNAGAIDIGWVGPAPAINAYSQSHGRNLRIISGATSGGASLVVNPRRIHSLADLRGKTIATPQLGNTQDVSLLNFLAEHHYKESPQTGKGDVKVNRIDNKTVTAAFREGQVDGAWVPEPTASQLLAVGGRTLVDENTLWPGGRFVTTNVVVSQSFLKAHPDVVAAVLRGSVETNAWIRTHKAQAEQAVNAQLRALSGKALPGSVLTTAFGNIQVTDDPLASTLRQEARHAVQAGLLGRPDLNGIYDLAPLNKVLTANGRPQVSDAGL